MDILQRISEIRTAKGMSVYVLKGDEVESFIDEIECMSKVRKEFYKNIIRQRYDVIKDVYNTIKRSI